MFRNLFRRKIIAEHNDEPYETFETIYQNDFELTEDEAKSLRSKISTLTVRGRGQHRKYTTKVFTEQGIYMLATVLKSDKATDVTLSIMRTFTKLRHYAIEHTNLAMQIQELS